MNPMIDQKILEAILRQPLPQGTPPFNPNAGTGPQIGPTMPGQVRGGMLNRTSPVDMDTILGFEGAIPPIQGPGMAGMSPPEPGYGVPPAAPWSGSETASKRQDLNYLGIKDDLLKQQELIKKPRAKANMKSTFGKQDLPIALIGGLLAWLAGGRNRGKSVSQFVQSFAGFNKQRADEHNQAEMQRVEEENRATELEIASQKIGIDLKKLEYDEQEKVLERFRAEEKRTQSLEDYAKKVDIDLGADLKKIGAKDAGAVAKGEAARLQDRLLTLDDKELGSRGIAYLKLAMADGVLDVEDMNYISKTFLTGDTVTEANKRGVRALNSIKTRTAEEMLPIEKRLKEAGIALREDEHKKFNLLFPLMDDVQLAELIYKKKQSENITNLIKNRDKNTAVAELRADNAKYTGATGLYRALMTGHTQQAAELRARLTQEDANLATLEFELRKAQSNYQSETNKDQKESYGAKVRELEGAITAQKAIVNPIKESIKANQEEYGSVVKQLQDLQKAVESGRSTAGGSGGGGAPGSSIDTSGGAAALDGNGGYVPFVPPPPPAQPYQDRPASKGPVPQSKKGKKNPNLSKVAAGLGMGAIGGMVKKVEQPKPKGKKTRTVKIGDKTITVDEN